MKGLILLGVVASYGESNALRRSPAPAVSRRSEALMQMMACSQIVSDASLKAEFSPERGWALRSRRHPRKCESEDLRPLGSLLEFLLDEVREATFECEALSSHSQGYSVEGVGTDRTEGVVDFNSGRCREAWRSRGFRCKGSSGPLYFQLHDEHVLLPEVSSTKRDNRSASGHTTRPVFRMYLHGALLESQASVGGSATSLRVNGRQRRRTKIDSLNALAALGRSDADVVEVRVDFGPSSPALRELSTTYGGTSVVQSLLSAKPVWLAEGVSASSCSSTDGNTNTDAARDTDESSLESKRGKGDTGSWLRRVSSCSSPCGCLQRRRDTDEETLTASSDHASTDDLDTLSERSLTFLSSEKEEEEEGSAESGAQKIVTHSKEVPQHIVLVPDVRNIGVFSGVVWRSADEFPLEDEMSCECDSLHQESVEELNAESISHVEYPLAESDQSLTAPTLVSGDMHEALDEQTAVVAADVTDAEVQTTENARGGARFDFGRSARAALVTALLASTMAIAVPAHVKEHFLSRRSRELANATLEPPLVLKALPPAPAPSCPLLPRDTHPAPWEEGASVFDAEFEAAAKRRFAPFAPLRKWAQRRQEMKRHNIYEDGRA